MKSSSIKIVIVTGVAAVALLGALLTLFSIEASRETTRSPMQINYEEIQLKRTKELPEVISFLHIYPNALESNSSGPASGPFVLMSKATYPDRGFTQVVTLTVYVRTIPLNTGSQYERQGINQPYHDYYYTTELRCHPTVDGTEIGLNGTIWSMSDELCEQDKMQLYQNVSKLSDNFSASNDSGNAESLSKLSASIQALTPADRATVESANELDIVQAYLGRFPEAEVTSVRHQNMYSAGPEPVGTVHTISYSYVYAANETSKLRQFRDLHITLVEEGKYGMQYRISLACGSSLGGSAIAEINSVNSTEQTRTLCPLPYEK